MLGRRLPERMITDDYNRYAGMCQSMHECLSVCVRVRVSVLAYVCMCMCIYIRLQHIPTYIYARYLPSQTYKAYRPSIARCRKGFGFIEFQTEITRTSYEYAAFPSRPGAAEFGAKHFWVVRQSTFRSFNEGTR